MGSFLFGIAVSWQAIVLLTGVSSSICAILAAVYSLMNRRKYRREKRWLDLLEAAKNGHYWDIDKEWKARMLSPITWENVHIELGRERQVVEDLEHGNDLWPPLFAGLTATLAIVAIVVAYLFTR